MEKIYSGFTALTPERLLIGPGAVYLDYGLPGERLLGATDGGNSFNLGVSYRDIAVDKPFGMVKGLRQIQNIQPTIQTNLKELSVDNLKAIIPGLEEVAGTNNFEMVPAEYVGDGDAAQTTFTLANGNVVASSLRVYLDGVLTSAYTLTAATGQIVFDAAPANGVAITAAYTYNTGAASDHTILRINPLADSHYFANVALLGTAKGKNKPVVIVIKNALASVEGDTSLEQDDEATLQVTFTGTFASADIESYLAGTVELPDIAPVEVRWPNS